jgi:hypothetical protein
MFRPGETPGDAIAKLAMHAEQDPAHPVNAESKSGQQGHESGSSLTCSPWWLPGRSIPYAMPVKLAPCRSSMDSTAIKIRGRFILGMILRTSDPRQTLKLTTSHHKSRLDQISLSNADHDCRGDAACPCPSKSSIRTDKLPNIAPGICCEPPTKSPTQLRRQNFRRLLQ